MFLLQFRSFCQIKQGPRCISQLKHVVLNSIEKNYETRWEDYGGCEYSISEIVYECKFYEAYFDFATFSRSIGKNPWSTLSDSERRSFVYDLKTGMKSINKQAIDWAKADGSDLMNLRKVRSTFTFLETDFISNEDELKSSLDWRLLKNQGISEIDDNLISRINDHCWCEEKIDLRGVPLSHNWWAHGNWTFDDSEKEFGENVVKGMIWEYDRCEKKGYQCKPAHPTEPITPILPIIEFKKDLFPSNYYINVRNTSWVKNLPEGYLHILHGIFQRHLNLRSLPLHPISTFSYKQYHEAGYLRTIKSLDVLVSYSCDHPEMINPLVVRSAIQFLEEDIVPFDDGAASIWQEFQGGRGMKRLNDLVLKQLEVPTKYQDLKNIPLNHTWWPETCRRNAGKVADFPVAFAALREKMLCYLQNLAETPEENEDILKNTLKFHKHYFDYIKSCLKYKQDPIEMMGRDGTTEFHENFARSLNHLETALMKFEEDYYDVTPLRRMRSSLEFLGEQERENEELQKILKGRGMRRLEKTLRERFKKSSYFPYADYYKAQSKRRYLDGVPRNHTWWPIKEFKSWN